MKKKKITTQLKKASKVFLAVIIIIALLSSVVMFGNLLVGTKTVSNKPSSSSVSSGGSSNTDTTITTLADHVWKTSETVNLNSWPMSGNDRKEYLVEGYFNDKFFNMITVRTFVSGEKGLFLFYVENGGMITQDVMCINGSSSSYVVSFDGGTDCNNKELIAWLKANGTLI